MKHMKTTTLFFGFVIFTVSLFGQSTPQKYPDLIRIADSLYNAKDFKNSAFTFSKAFKDNAVEANKQYINQAVLLEGDITTISGVTVTLNNVACNIDSTEVGKIKDLKVGSKVKIQGLVVGYNDLMEEIALAQCTIK